MNKFEFIVRSEIRRESEWQLYRMVEGDIANYDLTLERVIDSAIENILEYNDFENLEYESGITWCVSLAIENILNLEVI